MSNKYGLKKSPALRLCQIVAALLFVVFFASFWLMFVDIGMFTEISEEKKEELISQTSFQTAVRLADEISKNQNEYGKVDTINTISYLKFITRGIENDYTSIYLRVTKVSGSDIYFQFYKGFKTIDANTYNSAKSREGSIVSSTETVFNVAEVKYIKELLTQENIDELIYEFKKNEVTSTPYWEILRKTIKLGDVFDDFGRLQSVCIGSPYTNSLKETMGFVKITFGDGSIKYYRAVNGSFTPMLPEDYNSGLINEYCYEQYELEVFYKESGLTWH